MPKQLGRYEILSELGKGAMGVVYLAQDPIIGRKVALKTFRVGFSAQDKELEQFRARFLREAQSAGILNHPNIVTIHDVVSDPGADDFFIAMEYVQGTDLKQLMQREDRLHLPFVLDIVAQIATGLDYAHDKGVIHRDIKPANIIITKDEQAKITDFGIARVNASNLTVEGQLLGTPNYMAPEQIMGRPVDHRADIFSLGVMLYEMLTGHKPFAGNNLTMVTHRIVYEAFTPPERIVAGLPPQLTQILERALAKDVEKRYNRGAEMAGDLHTLLKPSDGSSSSAMSSAASFVEPLPPPVPDAASGVFTLTRSGSLPTAATAASALSDAGDAIDEVAAASSLRDGAGTTTANAAAPSAARLGRRSPG
ncbi:MAG: serine/threonine-protein kinase, partial [Acidobacteriota bacterium]